MQGTYIHAYTYTHIYTHIQQEPGKRRVSGEGDVDARQFWKFMDMAASKAMCGSQSKFKKVVNEEVKVCMHACVFIYVMYDCMYVMFVYIYLHTHVHMRT